MIKFWSYTREYKKIRKEILKKLDKTFLKGDIFFGTELDNFENYDLG